MPAPDTITLQEVVTGILVPVVAGGFWLLWHRAHECMAAVDRLAAKDKASRDEIWNALNAERGNLQSHRVECERRFARVEELQRLEERIEDRFDRLEEKLDRALAR